MLKPVPMGNKASRPFSLALAHVNHSWSWFLPTELEDEKNQFNKMGYHSSSQRNSMPCKERSLCIGKKNAVNLIF